MYGRRCRIALNSLTAKLFLIGIFTHLKLCLADAIHNFKWLKIIQIWHLADWGHILGLRCLKTVFDLIINKNNTYIIAIGGWWVNHIK